jgi:hypothetical protein
MITLDALDYSSLNSRMQNTGALIALSYRR